MIQVGQVLNNTYVIMNRLGSGGGGIVFKAYHRRMRKHVAIKLIKDSVNSDFYNRSEVDVLKNLKNDYLPQVLDFVEDGDDVYTVMEFVEGQNFKQLITSGKTFSEKQVRKYALQLCEAVRYLHTHVPPIIHSDIKPANVMLTPSDNICLIDFNISMMSDNGIAVSKGGSRDFGAPEQFRRVINAPYEVDEFHEETRFIENEETEILTDESEIYNSKSAKTKNVSKAYIDMRTDIYGIGATIYYMLTSRVPVGGRADFRGINCSSAIKDAIEKAMNPEPAKRFRTVSEFEAALKRHISVKRIVLPVVASAVVLTLGFGICTTIQNSYKYPQNEEILIKLQSHTMVEQTYEQAIVEFEKTITATAETTSKEYTNEELEEVLLTLIEDPNSDVEQDKLDAIKQIEYLNENLYAVNRFISDKYDFNFTFLRSFDFTVTYNNGKEETYNYGTITDISFVTRLKNLTSLSLNNNQISDISALSGLTNLTRLSLDGNQISDISALSGLTNLTYLSLNGNQISNVSSLSGLTNLETLCLEDNQISDINTLNGLTNLICLFLDDNQIIDISTLSGLTDLTVLHMSYNQIGNISSLSGLTNLETLWLDDNQISDISALSGLINLTDLQLSFNQIIDISSLSGLINLKSLYLTNNQISDSDIGNLEQSLPNCSITY